MIGRYNFKDFYLEYNKVKSKLDKDLELLPKLLLHCVLALLLRVRRAPRDAAGRERTAPRCHLLHDPGRILVDGLAVKDFPGHLALSLETVLAGVEGEGLEDVSAAAKELAVKFPN
jgi:hypothetical protein